MDFINDINCETLIICSDSVKKHILKTHKLVPIKIMNMTEFMHKYLFAYDDEAILFVMNEYHVKYEIAKEYIDNIYYVSDIKYGVEKLELLCDIKKKLIDNDLLIYNYEFINYAKRIPIIIYNLDMNDYYLNMFKNLNYKIIDRKYNNYTHDIYEFDTMEDEVYYVGLEIAKLIDKGIDVSNIKLTNIGSEYYNTIERIFSLLNLKVNIKYKRLLNSYDIVRDFINKYNDNNDIDNVLESLDKDDIIYNELVKVINKYRIYNNKELLIHKLEHSYISGNNYNNAIEIIDYLNYISNDDEYIFMLGFNEGIIPRNYMDTEYITDNIVPLVGLSKTREKNIKIRDNTLKIIGDIKNLIITYKLKDDKREYYPSNLCNMFNVTRKNINYLDSYSATYDKLRLVNMYDNYYKFGYKDANFDLFNASYKLKYNSYSNKFSGINRDLSKLYLSYSKMNNYNKCAFKYYLSDILKLDIYEENFSTIIGSMVHFVMEECLSNNDMDIDKYVNIFLKDREFSKKEMFFLDKYKECIHELLDQVLLEKEYSLFNQAMYEKKIDIELDKDIHFVGIIDKVLYYIDNDKTYVSIIDYKTGNDDISLKYLKYGLNIQLPIYLYLASKLDIKNIIYTGFYLQKFNITDNDYRLVGYSNSDKDILSVQDKNYDNSKVIKGLKTNKDGSFSKTSRVVSNEEINDILVKTKEQIDLAIKKIRANEFNINPKIIDNKNISCMYCKFKDICYKTNEDEVVLEVGDSNGIY